MTDVKATPALSTPPPRIAPPALAPGATLWALVAETTPLASSASLLAAAQQQLGKGTTENLQQLLALRAGKTPDSQATTAPQSRSAATASPLDSAALEARLLAKLQLAPRLLLAQVRIGSTTLPLITDQPLQPGQKVQLRVGERGLQLLTQPTPPRQPPPLQSALQTALQTGQPQSAHPSRTATPVTATHGSTTAQQALSPAAKSTLLQTLRQALPLQTPPDQLLSTLAQLRKTTALPEPANLAVRQLLNSALTLPPDSNAVRQALASAGLFTESSLTQALAATPHKLPIVSADTKLNLWQLLVHIAPSTGAKSAVSPLMQQLLSLLGGSPAGDSPARPTPALQVLKELGQQWLAKIVTQQLSQLLDERPAGETRLTLELPARNDQHWLTLPLQLHKYWQQPEDDQPQPDNRPAVPAIPVWQVTLSLQLAQLGQLDARVRIIQDELHCSLWAEQPDTLALIEEQAAQLAEKIRARGLKVKPIQCHAGRLPQPTNQLNSPLLDIHA